MLQLASWPAPSNAAGGCCLAPALGLLLAGLGAAVSSDSSHGMGWLMSRAETTKHTDRGHGKLGDGSAFSYGASGMQVRCPATRAHYLYWAPRAILTEISH